MAVSEDDSVSPVSKSGPNEKGDCDHCDITTEKALGSTSEAQMQDTENHLSRSTQFHRLGDMWARYGRHFFRFLILAVFTGWWISGLVLHRNDRNWVVPFLLWFCIAARIVLYYIRASVLLKPFRWTWQRTVQPTVQFVPPNWRHPAAGLAAFTVFVVGSFASPTTPGNSYQERGISLLGLVVFLVCLISTSKNRALINWNAVIAGLLMQFVVALFVLRTNVGYDIFTFIATLAARILGFSSAGVAFLTADPIPEVIRGWWLTNVVSAVIFFVAIIATLIYIGFLQWFVQKFATFFFWAMQVSGVEAVVAVACPFVGQGESAILVRPFVAHLTNAEFHQVLTSGFSTIAGSVLIVYIQMGIDPRALVSACIMSIPSSLVVSKIRFPETEEPLTAGRVTMPQDDNPPGNVVEAFANGAIFGLRIAATIATTVFCIVSLVACIDAFLSWWGGYLNATDPNITLDLIMGYLCYPVAFLLGASREHGDLLRVSRLLGIKLITNEFVAYQALQTQDVYDDLSDRSRIIVTYALCGFASLGGLGVGISILAQLAPNRSAEISRMAVSAVICGAMSTWIGACIAGLIIT